MRRSHSYSKRELLDSCLRQFLYEYYAASKRLPFDPVRKPAVQEMKEFIGFYLLAGEKLHWFIEQFLKKGQTSRAWVERTCVAAFDLAVRYSRDPEGNAGLRDAAYPPPMLLEFTRVTPEPRSWQRRHGKRCAAESVGFWSMSR